MINKQILWLITASLSVLSPLTKADLIYSEGETCPEYTSLVPVPTEPVLIADMCQQMGQWDIARLGNQASLAGPGYGCKINPHDPLGKGHAFCAQVKELYLPGEDCPNGYSHINLSEIQDNTAKYCDMLPPGGAARIDSSHSLSGIAGHCELHSLAKDPTHEISASLCALEDRVTSQSSCPIGTEFLQGSNTQNYCIPIGSASGQDHKGRDMCADSGKGDFVAIKSVFTSRAHRISMPVKDIDGNFVTLAPGIRTLICAERPLPVYSSSGHIVACPLGAEPVMGQSAAEHCAYIWGEPGIDTSGNNVCRDFGGFDQYIYRVPRAPRALIGLSYTNPLTGETEREYPDGQRIVLCKNETQPYVDGNNQLICPPYSERILSTSAGDHCALKGGDPGYDIDNDRNVCRKAGEGDFVRYLVNAQGQKVLVCENETQTIPEAVKLVQSLKCEPDQEFIKSSSWQPSVYDHCRNLDAAPGLDNKNKDVCKASGLEGFKQYSFPGGVKTLICECPEGNKGCNGSGDAEGEARTGGNVN